jgi:hypothetical protein
MLILWLVNQDRNNNFGSRNQYCIAFSRSCVSYSHSSFLFHMNMNAGRKKVSNILASKLCECCSAQEMLLEVSSLHEK